MIFQKKNISISLLAAYTAKDRVIGAQGKIPWKLSSERNRFKSICNNKYVIIGRKSFDEIGKALSYCTLVIVSKKMKTAPEGCLLCKSYKKAVRLIYRLNSGADCAAVKPKGAVEILVAGGESIYKKAIKHCSKIYATEIKKDFKGDRFFPSLKGKWTKKVEQTVSEDGIEYDYVLFTKG